MPFDHLMQITLDMPRSTAAQAMAQRRMIARINALETAYGCLKRAIALSDGERAAPIDWEDDGPTKEQLMSSFALYMKMADAMTPNEGYNA